MPDMWDKAIDAAATGRAYDATRDATIDATAAATSFATGHVIHAATFGRAEVRFWDGIPVYTERLRLEFEDA